MTDWLEGELLNKTSLTINISDFGGTPERKLLSSAFYQQNTTHTRKSDGQLWLTNWFTASAPLRQSLLLSQHVTASLEIHAAVFQTTPCSWRRRTVDGVGRTLNYGSDTRSRRHVLPGNSEAAFTLWGGVMADVTHLSCSRTSHIMKSMTACSSYTGWGRSQLLEETKTSCKYFG